MKMFIRIREDFVEQVSHHDEQTGDDYTVEVLFLANQVFLAECQDVREDETTFHLPTLGIVRMANADWEEYQGRVMHSLKGWTAG